MNPKSPSRLPRLIRSIFLPRKSVAPASALPVQTNRMAEITGEPVGSVDVVLRQVTDTTAIATVLRSPNAETACEAAITLGHSGDPAAVEPLIDVLANQQGYFHAVVRATAAKSLGQLKDARAVEPLIAATGDSTAEISQEAALALGAIGDPRAINPLMNIVSNRTGFFLNPVRGAAIKSLGQFHDAKVASMLLAISVDESEDPDVRQAAKDVRPVA